MGKTITSLTAAQKARFPEFTRKWIEIGLSTKPADRERAEKAIAGLYKIANLKEPRVIWLILDSGQFKTYCDWEHALTWRPSTH